MKIEWDDAKNAENIRKHFLDFADAQLVFTAPMLVETDDRFEYGEIRSIGIGFLNDLIVVLVFTERSDDIIRIISFRRALKHERERFYQHLRNQLGATKDDA